MAQFASAGAALGLSVLGEIIPIPRALQQTTNATTDRQHAGTIDVIPDFATLGITDPNLIRKELRRGPAISFYIGPEEAHFTLPVRLAIYCSAPPAGSLDNLDEFMSLKFPKHDPKAFAKVQTWLNEGSFRFFGFGHYISSHSDLRAGIQEACMLLAVPHLLPR